MDTRNPVTDIRGEFIEKNGLVAQGEGLPRIAGRIMGLLIFDGRPFSFSELAEELQVSRGSVSSNARLLEELGVIERTTRPGERQDYFKLADQPYVSIMRSAQVRANRSAIAIQKTIDRMPDGNPDILERLEAYRQFYDAVSGGIVEITDRLKR